MTVIVCVCENLPGTWEQRVTPFVLHTTSLQGDGRVARGAPSTEALPALTFVHFACQFVLLVRHSFASDVARGRNLTPDGSSHLVLHAILDVWHVWHKNFHPSFIIIIILLLILLSLALALALCRIYQCVRVCVCVCVFFCVRVCVCSHACVPVCLGEGREGRGHLGTWLSGLPHLHSTSFHSVYCRVCLSLRRALRSGLEYPAQKTSFHPGLGRG